MNIREKFCIWLFDISKTQYANLFKKKLPWTTTRKDLLMYPADTLGNTMGHFLETNDFQLIPKLERHDAYHVITGYSTEVKGEIELQYFFLGNGKRSLYQYGVILLGACIIPEYISSYIQAYHRGQESS
jgi:ubiquinone biosynthesis protein Coq4